MNRVKSISDLITVIIISIISFMFGLVLGAYISQNLIDSQEKEEISLSITEHPFPYVGGKGFDMPELFQEKNEKLAPWSIPAERVILDEGKNFIKIEGMEGYEEMKFATSDKITTYSDNILHEYPSVERRVDELELEVKGLKERVHYLENE